MRHRHGTTHQPRWVHGIWHVEHYSTLTGRTWRWWTGLERDTFTERRDNAGTWQSEALAWWAIEQYDLCHYYDIRVVQW